LDLVQPEVDPYNTPTPKTTLVPNMWIANYYDTIRYDTIGEINVDSKAEYAA